VAEVVQARLQRGIRSAFAALLAALVWATIIAARRHEAKNHAHQAEAARQALHHLHNAADHALVPVIDNLAARQPSDQASRTLAHNVRAAVLDHADRILTDPAWPALATVLADAEAGGHKPHQLLVGDRPADGSGPQNGPFDEFVPLVDAMPRAEVLVKAARFMNLRRAGGAGCRLRPRPAGGGRPSGSNS